VVPASGSAPAVADLRVFLLKKFPDYMVPARFVVLDQIPLTRNGKIDAKALPAPELDMSVSLESRLPPRNRVEQMLADIWSQVLNLESVGINDNFFELGGDSILSIQITARANRAGLGLTPMQLFKHQTIAELALVAGQGNGLRAEQGLIVGPVPLTPIQHWFFDQDVPARHHWNQAVLLELEGALDAGILPQVVAEVLKQHDALRLRFSRGATGWRQRIADNGDPVPFVKLDFSDLPGASRKAALEKAATGMQSSLNLTAGPLIRVAQIVFGPDQPTQFVPSGSLPVQGVRTRDEQLPARAGDRDVLGICPGRGDDVRAIARHRDGIQYQACPLEAAGAGANVAALNLDVGAHGLQPGHVDIDGARTDGAATRQGDVRATKSGHQRAEHQDRGAHRLHQVVRREAFLQCRGIHFDAQPFGDGHTHAHAAEQFDRGGDILQVRHIADCHRVRGQQACRQNRQRRVLGAGDAHFALERHAARDL